MRDISMHELNDQPHKLQPKALPHANQIEDGNPIMQCKSQD